jgi:hypothetical protein
MAWRQRRSYGKSGACSWPPPNDLWGVLCLPWQSAKGNSSKLLISLSYLTCSALGELGIGLPISHRTMKWWSTQWGRSMSASTWTSREKLCVTFVIYFLDFSRWLVFILLWLVHSSTWRYKDHLPLFYIPQTSCNKLFSVISFESLYFLC